MLICNIAPAGADDHSMHRCTASHLCPADVPFKVVYVCHAELGYAGKGQLCQSSKGISVFNSNLKIYLNVFFHDIF